ncbi:MAG: hypothetical protein IJO03_01140 [Clostridia bacterium]|nr:hypothetical protein [Clostridia bacterium]
MIKITNKNRKNAVVLILSAFFAVLTGLFLFTPNRAEILVPGNTAITVDGLNVSVGFYNYFFSSSTTPEIMLELEKEYDDFDGSVPLDEQIYDEKTGKTWAEYIDETVKEQISRLVKAYNEGVSAGVSIFDEQQKSVDAIIKSIEAEADKLSVRANDYTCYTYGDYVGIKTVKKILEMSYVAQNYYEYFSVQSKISSDEYDSYYEKNKDMLASVEYLCCKITGVTDINEMKTAAEMLLPKISGSNFEQVLTEGFSKHNIQISQKKALLLNSDENEDIKKWLFNDFRKTGDKTVIADEKNESIYVVLSVNVPEIEKEITCSAREIALRVNDFGNWDELDKIANEIENNIKKAENKEYAFAVYADIYMNNLQDGSSGGLITNLKQSNGKAETWLFDSKRRREDFIRLKTENGYYLIMFIDKKPSWQFWVDDEIKNEEFKSNMKNIEFKTKFAFRYTKG